MSRVHHLAPWRRQPDVPVTVDWANPLTRGLKFLYVSRRMSDAVSGTKGAPTSAVFRRTVPPVGLGTANGATTDRISFGNLSALNITGPITCLALGAQGTYFGDASAVSKVVTNGGTNTPFDFGTLGASSFGSGVNGGVRLGRANAGGFRVWSGSQQLVVNRAYCIAATQGGDIGVAPTFYVDGVRDGTSTNRFGGSGSGAATTNTAAVLVQNRGDNSTYWDGGGLALTAVWDRQLSEAEIRALSANVWQLFRPRVVDVFPANAAGSHTATGALVGPGSTLSGTAVHRVLHTASGALTGPGSSITGTARKFRAHSASGTLTGPGSTLSGSADHITPGGAKNASGALVGPGSTLSGTAVRRALHTATGALVGPGAVLAGSATHTAPFVATVTLTLYDKSESGRTVVPDITGIEWAWYDNETTLLGALATTPTDSGASESVAGGVCVLSLPSSAKTSGQTGLLFLTIQDGENTRSLIDLVPVD